MTARLAAFVAAEEGVAPGDVGVAGLRRLAGGASRELWALDLELAGRRLELVLRRDPPGRAGGGDRGLEVRLLRAAAEAGVPVPRVRWSCADPALLGSGFFLMDRVPGEAIPRRLLRDPRFAAARTGLAAELGTILARLHRIDPARPELADLAASQAGDGSGGAEVRRIGEALRNLAVEPHPVLDLAERWLLERAPESARRVVVHGDYRLGNVIVGEDGVRAVLDWELCHLGDPVEDLGWLCVRAWRFGNDDRPAAGVGSREELLEAYRRAGGEAVDPEALRFWEACGNFKLALVFVTQARVFLDGLPSVELASLGRRIAEAEDELLRFMDGRA